MHKYLLIGFKGSGKTALVRKIMMCNDTTKCTSECNLHPKFCDLIDFEGIYINADKDLHLNEFLIYYTKQNYQDVALRDYGKDMLEAWEILCKIKTFEKISELQDDEEYLELKNRYLGSKKETLQFNEILGIGERTSTNTEKDDLFHNVQKKAIDILENSEKRYYIIFDGFDHFLDKSIFSDKPEMKIKFVRDLSDSLRTLGYNFQDDTPGIGGDLIGLPNVYLKILLPRDFIIDKLRDDIKYLDEARCVQLRWLKNDLKKFITARLSYFITKKPTDFSKLEPDIIWKQVFAERVKNRHYNVSESSFDYILRHTSYRPRDLQIICGEILTYIRQVNMIRDKYFHNSLP